MSIYGWTTVKNSTVHEFFALFLHCLLSAFATDLYLHACTPTVTRVSRKRNFWLSFQRLRRLMGTSVFIRATLRYVMLCRVIGNGAI